MNTKEIIIGVVTLLLGLVIGFFVFHNSSNLGAVTLNTPRTETNPVWYYNGLKAGNDSEFIVDSSGALTLQSTGTTTMSALSSSSTKGFCFQFNATSTATELNMTFAASTTAATTVGVAPIIRYGACP